MVVIDTTIFLLMLRPETSVPVGPNGVAVEKVKERIDHLVERLEKTRTKIMVPTPVLSEALVRIGTAATQDIIEGLGRYSVFQVEPFDMRAALEVAASTREALTKGSKKGTSEAGWQKVKFDRQIAAIAKVNGAKTIYSDDRDLHAIAPEFGLEVIGLADLPLPPEDPQLQLDYQPLSSPESTGEDIEDDDVPEK